MSGSSHIHQVSQRLVCVALGLAIAALAIRIFMVL
jgi:hypothetical protein